MVKLRCVDAAGMHQYLTVHREYNQVGEYANLSMVTLIGDDGRRRDFMSRRFVVSENISTPDDTGDDLHQAGVKDDKDKRRDNLLYSGCPNALAGLATVLTYGANKYTPNGWKTVEVERYWDAFYRHLNAFQAGEVNDEESGLPHLDHALTNLMFIQELRHDSV